ncbi:MAG: isopentenyl-diphosphate Delta-isomerase [Pseudomonadota bacterium]
MVASSDLLERVVLVDENDLPIGIGPKLMTHQEGALHRAFSIFLFDSAGRTLVQKRASHKYHSGGKWANTCCGHPRPGEEIGSAAARRLGEELGMQADLQPGFIARYRAELDGQMIENEIVHIFFGRSVDTPVPNPEEASDVKFVSLEDLQSGSELPLSSQTAWLRHYIETHFRELASLRDGII